MKLTVLGGSGFIGRHLVAAASARGDDVTVASLRQIEAAARACEGAQVVVNLAGAPIAKRWTAQHKAELRRSRVDLPRDLLARIAKFDERPRAYVSASAIGYYGTSETAAFTETSPPGDDFLARLCADWEREAKAASALGMRVAIVRTGLALGRDGGMLAMMLLPFRLGLGGKIGSGRQVMSWIHIDDLVGIYLHAIDTGGGAYNATAPNAVTNAEFTLVLGKALHRPVLFPVPIPALALILGEGASIAAEGQRVLPERTLASGYKFRYAHLGEALKALLG